MSSQKHSDEVNVFRYINYRDYLRDFYVNEKKRRASFSYRAFSKRAKIGSPNHLQRVIEGARNLSPELAGRFAQACRLTDEGADFFVLLVEYNQIREPAGKQKLFRKMAAMRRFQETQSLSSAQGAYFSQWYIPAIRELVARKDFIHDPAWIATQLIPPITEPQAQSALDLLFDLGLLTRDAHGHVIRTKALVSTGDEVTQFQMGGFHKEMMQLAVEAIEHFPRDQRDLSVLTLALGPEGLRQLKIRLQQLRKEILELESIETEVCQIVQLNFQLFPLSNHTKKPAS